ncbi:hypothetical protein J2W27_001665 [Variovorax boronicumulans]|nr:hypothetical protein [Variovorax boronicumulans]
MLGEYFPFIYPAAFSNFESSCERLDVARSKL